MGVPGTDGTIMRISLFLLALAGACGTPAATDDDTETDVETDETDVETDDSDTGDDPDDTDDTDVDGFPNPITYLDDPLPGAWSDAFSLPGVEGGSAARVQALATLPDGRLVIGGIFDHIGPTPVANLAVREASGAWVPLDGGVDFYVEDLLVHDDDLWVVGWSEGEDGLLGQVARWDGSTWFRHGEDLEGRVFGVDLYDDVVHVTGEFASIGGEEADGLARFEDAAWVGYDGLFGPEDYGTLRSAFAGRDGELCVSGAFGVVGGQDGGGVACLGDGWEPWGRLDGEVYGVAQLPNGRWMAWGGFAIDTDGNFNFVIGLGTWSDGAWVAPEEGGVDGGLVITVRDLLPQGDDGYVITGQFGAVGTAPGKSGTAASYVGAFDGTSWSGFGGGLRDTIGIFAANVPGGYALHDDDDLWIGGLFHDADGSTTLGLAGWDGTGWVLPFDASESLGLPGFSEDVAVGIDGSVWVVSVLAGAGGPIVQRFTGTGWETPAHVPAGTPADLHVVDGIVHLAGDLTVDLAGCDVAAHVAPQRWRCVVSGLGGLVTRMGHDDDGHLILAGDFSVGGLVGVAKWDGSALVALGAGLTAGSPSYVAVAPDGRVAVAGYGLESGRTDLGDLALWDGTAWAPIPGMEGYVYDLTWFDGDLVVAGGFFRRVGGPGAGDPIGSLIRWDGAAWTDLGELTHSSGNEPYTWLVRSWGDGLFVMGDFDAAGDTPLGRLAWFDGTTWASLGGGPDDLVNDLAVGEDDVWIAGPFLKVDGKPSFSVARWVVGAP